MIQSVDGRTPDKPVSAYVHPSAVVIGDVVLGEDSSVWPTAVLRGDLQRIEIGKNTNIQDGCVLHTSKFKLKIGDGVAVGHRAVLHSCEIGSGTLVGSGAIILDAAKVGENCLVAAGALIPMGKVIPPGSVVMGQPARIVRDITQEEIEDTVQRCNRYREMAKKYIRTGIIR
jgi:carbonic anhydrase/acetyltransferase-like protein (isoleucine patch superfamily)